MNVMIRDRLQGGWAKVVPTLMIVVVAALGFCLFDGDRDGDHDSMSPDLCLSILATSLVVTLLAGPAPSGWAITYRLHPAPVVGRRVPALPPKSPLLG